MMELAVATTTTTTYLDLLEAQEDLFRSQIEKLQYIVATQCKLTGVNPLSQEMAAGALSIKIGKRPRDFLNPKAVKYMQSVFSIKDAISKKETREISARFGVTVTQVRDLFTCQRSRVRKFVRLSREKAGRCGAHDAVHDPVALSLDPNTPAEAVPLDTMAPANIEEGPSCSVQHDVLTGMEGLDRYFSNNIFSLMRKEESYIGQVKLLKWILRIKNSSVLKWFITEGGVMILATWLSQAATEEQTSFLHVILKVLFYLPLHEALPVHMSAILQSVNQLRFYRTSDISNRARILLSKWSKMFEKLRLLNKSRAVKSASDAQAEMLLEQSINEVMGNNFWDSKDDNSEALKLLSDSPDNHKKLDTSEPLKMLMASEDSNKKRGVLPSRTRERRKVQMVEYPSQRLAVRSPQVAKSTAAAQSRPLSADDIQKAKMRAQFMQSKYGKTITCSDDQVKPEGQNGCTSSQASVLPSVSKSHVQPEVEERMKLDSVFSRVANPQETHLNLEEHPWKKHKRLQIPWRIAPELKITETWCVETGAASKEVGVQKNRIMREREVVYRTTQEIPSDPREPWDSEMDYDDSLTPEIPIEQLPDIEPLETPSLSADGTKENVPPTASTSCGNMPEPDLELLAELLKNPELVFALTSGQAGNLSSDETVKLLDMIKANRANASGNLSGLGGKAHNEVEVSLPSPTPSSDIVPNGRRPDSRNPFFRQEAMGNGIAYQAPAAVTLPTSTLVHLQNQATTTLTPQPSAAIVQQSAYVVVPPVAASSSIHWQMPANPRIHHQTTYHPNAIQAELLGNVRLPSPPQQAFESIHHSQPPNNYNGYARGPVQAFERPVYELWSPDNSPSRQNQYIPGQNYHEPRGGNLRHGYGGYERAMPTNQGQPSGYRDHGTRDAGNERWRDCRR